MFWVRDPNDPHRLLAKVTFREGEPGDSGFAHIESDDDNIREFLMYYLDDPLNGHPVYLHGLGYRSGPHSGDREQFEVAMSTLEFHFPSFRAEVG